MTGVAQDISSLALVAVEHGRPRADPVRWPFEGAACAWDQVLGAGHMRVTTVDRRAHESPGRGPVGVRELAAAKVAIFLPNLGGGGVERVSALLAEGLAARGIDTEVVVVRAEGPHLAAVQAVVPVVDLHAGATRYSDFCSMFCGHDAPSKMRMGLVLQSAVTSGTKSGQAAV